MILKTWQFLLLITEIIGLGIAFPVYMYSRKGRGFVALWTLGSIPLCLFLLVLFDVTCVTRIIDVKSETEIRKCWAICDIDYHSSDQRFIPVVSGYGKSTTIVNSSDDELMLEEIMYGHGNEQELRSPLHILPHSDAEIRAKPDFLPDQVPPEKMKVEQNIGYAVKTWLHFYYEDEE